MSEIRRVTHILANPSPREPTGRVTYGFYKVENGKVILTDGGGVPVRRSTGDQVVHELKDGEDAEVWARILTKQFRQHIHGERKPGFSGPLRYEKTGWR